MSSSETLMRMPRSAVRYRPLHTETQRPALSRVARQPSPRPSQNSLPFTEPLAQQIMPGWCFVVLGMMISFALLYVGAVLR